jgi:signal peptidase I
LTALLILIGLAILAAPVLLRALLVEAFRIPSGGMFPTLEVQDHVFVSKSAYGVFSPSAPRRGDVVVFRYPDPDPNSPPTDFVQRVIALPGDTLLVESGAPSINGWKVPRCHLGRATVTSESEGSADFDVFVEFLEGRAYLMVLQHEGRYDFGVQGPYVVAPGEFWTLGDNRHNSADSRSWRGGQGAGVPFDHLRGRVYNIWLPPERAGTTLHGVPVLPGSLKQLQPELERCLAKAPSLTESTPPPR